MGPKYTPNVDPGKRSVTYVEVAMRLTQHLYDIVV